MKGQPLQPYCGLKSDYFPHLLWVRLWSFHFCPDKHSIWFPACMDTRCIKYMSETVQWGKTCQVSGRCLILPQSSTTHWGTKCISYYHDLRGSFIAVWLRRCQLGQWCMKLPPFIGMAFNQFLLGICPWLCSGGYPLQHSLHLTTQSHFIPPPPSLPPRHKYNQTCQERHSHSPTIVSDRLCRVLLHPSPCLLNSTGGGSMPGDPPPSFSFPASDLIVCSPTYTSNSRARLIFFDIHTIQNKTDMMIL